MLYIIFGTDIKKRVEAKEKIEKDLLSKKIILKDLLLVSKINKDNYFELENYFEKKSLFGERLLVNVDDILSKEESREYFYSNFKSFIDSENIFILDEPFAVTAVFQKLVRDFTKEEIKENLFDAKEIKEKKDTKPFYLCTLIEKRNKKLAWLEFQKIYLQWGDTEAQALHGAMWWKWKNIWSLSINNKKTNFTKEEIETFGYELSLMAMKANNGEVNLMKDIEKFILSL